MAINLLSQVKPAENQGLTAEWTFNKSLVNNPIHKELNALPSSIVDLIIDYLEDRTNVFGAKEWTTYCGKVEPAPPMPLDIETTWQKACYFHPHSKKIKHSHICVYIPKAIGGKPFTLKILSNIAKRYFPHNKEGFIYILPSIAQDFESKPIQKSYWVLMTKEALPETINRIISRESIFPSGSLYSIPKTLEVVSCILASYFISQKKTERLFIDDPLSYTYCEERSGECYNVIVGGFSEKGFSITQSAHYLSHQVGLCALQRIQSPEDARFLWQQRSLRLK